MCQNFIAVVGISVPIMIIFRTYIKLKKVIEIFFSKQRLEINILVAHVIKLTRLAFVIRRVISITEKVIQNRVEKLAVKYKIIIVIELIKFPAILYLVSFLVDTEKR